MTVNDGARVSYRAGPELTRARVWSILWVTPATRVAGERSVDMDAQLIAGVVRRHLATVLKESDFDVVAIDGGMLDVYTDAWTIHLEAGSGFLAIDEEPVEPAAY